MLLLVETIPEPGKSTFISGLVGSSVTVVIAAPGDVGEAAARVLEDRDVIHVTSAEAAHRELSDATVVVVGDVSGRSTTHLRRDALASGAAVVDLADVGTAADDATRSDDEIDFAAQGTALQKAVDRAECVALYRRAVDDFFETCRARAEGWDHPEIRRARTRAHRRFEELHDAVGCTAYRAVFGSRSEAERKDGRDDEPNHEREYPTEEADRRR